MTIKIHQDSHTDHGITEPLRNYVLDQFHGRDSFFVETVTYRENYERHVGPYLIERGAHESETYTVDLPAVSCALHLNVPEAETHYAKRGDRAWESRMCKRQPRMVREVTVVAGPHPDDPAAGMVLFTMYGGPEAPREPGDPSLEGVALEVSTAFWTHAALSE